MSDDDIEERLVATEGGSAEQLDTIELASVITGVPTRQVLRVLTRYHMTEGRFQVGVIRVLGPAVWAEFDGHLPGDVGECLHEWYRVDDDVAECAHCGRVTDWDEGGA